MSADNSPQDRDGEGVSGLTRREVLLIVTAWRSDMRSRHRPVAVVEGSATENLNKSWVRLWT